MTDDKVPMFPYITESEAHFTLFYYDACVNYDIHYFHVCILRLTP